MRAAAILFYLLTLGSDAHANLYDQLLKNPLCNDLKPQLQSEINVCYPAHRDRWDRCQSLYDQCRGAKMTHNFCNNNRKHCHEAEDKALFQCTSGAKNNFRDSCMVRVEANRPPP